MIITWAFIHHPWNIMSSGWSTLVLTLGSPPLRKDSRRSGTLFINTPSGKKKQDNTSSPYSSSSNRKMTIGTGCANVSTLATRLAEGSKQCLGRRTPVIQGKISLLHFIFCYLFSSLLFINKKVCIKFA
jgi:hypothetical protein